MFDKTNNNCTNALLIKKDSSNYPIVVEIISPKIEAVRVSYMNKDQIDFEAYIEKQDNISIDLGDIVVVKDKKYRLHQVITYSTFFYVLGEEYHA